MTFEEFFKKKRIDLTALEQGMQVLFFEFKAHFEQMGEKSFDHTKKYWFNKLRRQFPLAPEVKTEKAHIANPLAEQTVTEILVETVAAAPAPKLGFVPKFKAVAMGKPAASEEKKEEPATLDISANAEDLPDTTAATPTPKLGFTPKFKAGVTNKPAAEKKDDSVIPSEPATQTEQPETSAPASKLGFKPKFKAANIAKPVEQNEERVDNALAPEAVTFKKPLSNPEATLPEANVSKPVYKPKFNMKNLPPKKDDQQK